MNFNEKRQKPNQKFEIIQSQLPQNIQTFKQKLLSGNGFLVDKWALRVSDEDNETIDSSIIEGDFSKIYHQQASNLNNSDQNIEFVFGENIKYHQIGNAFLQHEITIEKELLLQLTEFL